MDPTGEPPSPRHGRTWPPLRTRTGTAARSHGAPAKRIIAEHRNARDGIGGGLAVNQDQEQIRVAGEGSRGVRPVQGAVANGLSVVLSSHASSSSASLKIASSLAVIGSRAARNGSPSAPLRAASPDP